MLRCLVVLSLFTALLSAQVTLVSPEPARSAAAQASTSSKPAPAARNFSSLLPERFGEWQSASTQKFGPFNAATLAGADSPVWIEYQYQNAEQRRYVSNGRTLLVEAVHTKDASGAVGLFTFYRSPGSELSAIPDGEIARPSGQPDQLLLVKDSLMVRAHGPLTREDVQALVAALGPATGQPMPALPQRLPREGLVAASAKYVLGPETLARIAPDLPKQAIDFEFDPEIALGDYQVPGNNAIRLVLVSYPTPQMAGAQLKAIEQGAVKTTGTIFATRKGPILAFALGAHDRAQAEELLKSVRYDAELTWNEPVEKMSAGQFGIFLINVFKLIGAWLAFAVAAGLLFGFVRILVKKWYPNQVFDRPEEVEVIRLNLNR